MVPGISVLILIASMSVIYPFHVCVCGWVGGGGGGWVGGKGVERNKNTVNNSKASVSSL